MREHLYCNFDHKLSKLFYFIILQVAVPQAYKGSVFEGGKKVDGNHPKYWILKYNSLKPSYDLCDAYIKKRTHSVEKLLRS